MIELKKIGEITENTINWYIVRRLGDEPLPLVYLHVPDLSPSDELLDEYKALRDAENWNSYTFSTIYLPKFIKEMTAETAIEKLEYLVKASREKDIALFCFCKTESLCHRSIIGGILKGMGADIDCSDEYVKYYRMYQEELARE